MQHAGKYGTLTHVPIHHLDRCLTFRELCALYSITDVCLVTSLRDGMNLVSYEFIACQAENHGVLVLSEFAGAAQSLGAGSLLVNPWNVNDVSHAILEVKLLPFALVVLGALADVGCSCCATYLVFRGVELPKVVACRACLWACSMQPWVQLWQ